MHPSAYLPQIDLPVVVMKVRLDRVNGQPFFIQELNEISSTAQRFETHAAGSCKEIQPGGM